MPMLVVMRMAALPGWHGIGMIDDFSGNGVDRGAADVAKDARAGQRASYGQKQREAQQQDCVTFHAELAYHRTECGLPAVPRGSASR